MKKVFYEVADLLPEMIERFNALAMFDALEEGDIVSVMPIKAEEIAVDFVKKTNAVLSDYFNVHDEDCYEADSYKSTEENPIFFWKDYLNCFYNLKLVDDAPADIDFAGTRFGVFEVTEVMFIDEVNKRLKQRRLDGIRLEYKVKATPMDRHNHWNRSYDKDF